MSIRGEVERIVHVVREQQGGSAALGNCIENAKVLKHAFEEAQPEWETKISYGGVDYDDKPTPESYVHAKKTGTHHLWVVVHTPNGTWHCDLASESEDCVPQGSRPMIRRGSPPVDYIDFGHRRDS